MHRTTEAEYNIGGIRLLNHWLGVSYTVCHWTTLCLHVLGCPKKKATLLVRGPLTLQLKDDGVEKTERHTWKWNQGLLVISPLQLLDLYKESSQRSILLFGKVLIEPGKWLSIKGRQLENSMRTFWISEKSRNNWRTLARLLALLAVKYPVRKQNNLRQKSFSSYGCHTILRIMEEFFD